MECRPFSLRRVNVSYIGLFLTIVIAILVADALNG